MVLARRGCRRVFFKKVPSLRGAVKTTPNAHRRNPKLPRQMSFSASPRGEKQSSEQKMRGGGWGRGALHAARSRKKVNPKDVNQFNLFFVSHMQLLSLYGLIKYSFSRASIYSIFLAFVIWTRQLEFLKEKTLGINYWA